jgi:hypothetical protein
MKKYVENTPMNVGSIEQTSQYKYSFDYVGRQTLNKNFTIDFEEFPNISGKGRQNLRKFLNNHDLIYCHFTNKKDPKGLAHAFLLKKEGSKLIIIDPHGTEFGQSNSLFNSTDKEHLEKMFPGKTFEESSCAFQGPTLGTCSLWTLLFLSFGSKNHSEILDLFKTSTKKLGLSNNRISYDLILIAIFEKFLTEGFATFEEIAKHPPGKYLEGLGKCRKCGGTKYTDALKKYNQGKPEWCMPRKGTPGHTEILNIIAKPKRKLGQKRILDSTPSKEAIVEEKKNMETPKRKLRSVKERENSKLMAMEDKDAPEIKVVKKKPSKEEECPICGKTFKNLKQHIFKSHTKLHLTFKKKGNEYLLSAVMNDGTILAENESAESTNDDGSENYFMGKYEVGWYVTLSKNKKVKVRSSTINKSGNETSQTAFKNWDVKFV